MVDANYFFSIGATLKMSYYLNVFKVKLNAIAKFPILLLSSC